MHAPHSALITTEQPATEQPATEQPPTEQPAPERPDAEQPAADPSLFEDVQVIEEAVAEMTGGSVPAAEPAEGEPLQRGKRGRQRPVRFGCNAMELTAAQIRRFDKSSGTRHERQPERPCQRADYMAKSAEPEELKRKLGAETTRRAAR